MGSRVEEYDWKVGRVRAYAADRGLDAVVLTRRCNFAWLTVGGLNHIGTGGEVGATSLVVMQDRVVCVTNKIEAPRVAAEELAGFDIEMWPYDWFDGVSAGRVWSDVLAGLWSACDVDVAGLPTTVTGLGSDFGVLRYTLTGWEIDRLRVLARATAETLESACRRVRSGMTEHELAGSIGGELLRQGIRVPTLLVAGDERVERYRHPIPTEKRFERYGMAVVGGERDGLIVSCSRLFSFGAVGKELTRKHEAVCRVDAAMMAATRPGRTMGDVFAVAEKAYGDEGYAGEIELHHQGGLAGYVAREVKATAGNTFGIGLNQMYAWNPSITGTKSEDSILVGEEGNEILTATGGWPTLRCEAGGRTWLRPAILVL